MKYPWADNDIKFNRAQENAKFALGRSANEEEIKQEYIKIGGKIIMDEIKNEVVPEVVEAPVVPVEPEAPAEEVVEESPKVESSESGDGSEAEPKSEEVVSESTEDVAL